MRATVECETPWMPACFPPPVTDAQLTRENCKEYLSRFLGWLHARFDAGDNIIELVATRSEYMDELLTRLWQKFGFDKTELTLIAVGGYGRGELHPTPTSTC